MTNPPGTALDAEIIIAGAGFSGIGMAIFLFLLAAVFGLALSDKNYNLKLLVGGPCVFAGFLWLRRALA